MQDATRRPPFAQSPSSKASKYFSRIDGVDVWRGGLLPARPIAKLVSAIVAALPRFRRAEPCSHRDEGAVTILSNAIVVEMITCWQWKLGAHDGQAGLATAVLKKWSTRTLPYFSLRDTATARLAQARSGDLAGARHSSRDRGVQRHNQPVDGLPTMDVSQIAYREEVAITGIFVGALAAAGATAGAYVGAVMLDAVIGWWFCGLLGGKIGRLALYGVRIPTCRWWILLLLTHINFNPYWSCITSRNLMEG